MILLQTSDQEYSVVTAARAGLAANLRLWRCGLGMGKVSRDSSVPGLSYRCSLPCPCGWLLLPYEISLFLQLGKRRCAHVNLGCPWDWAQPCNSMAKPSYFPQLELCQIRQKSRAFSPGALPSGLSAKMLGTSSSSIDRNRKPSKRKGQPAFLPLRDRGKDMQLGASLTGCKPTFSVLDLGRRRRVQQIRGRIWPTDVFAYSR